MSSMPPIPAQCGVPGTAPDLAMQRLLLATELTREQDAAAAASGKHFINAPRHSYVPTKHHPHYAPHHGSYPQMPHYPPPSSPLANSNKKSKKPEFLVKLYRMLQCEDPTVICWDNGRIHVHDPRVLGSTILHKYFRHSKYSSFQRQLNYFGFRKTNGKGKLSACTYTNFDLRNASLKSLLKIKRKTNAASKSGSIDLYDDVKDTASESSREEDASPPPKCIGGDRLLFLYQLAAAEDECEQEEEMDGMDEQGRNNSGSNTEDEYENIIWQQQEEDSDGASY